MRQETAGKRASTLAADLPARGRQICQRDIRQLADIERPAQMRALLRLVAARSGQLLVDNSLSNDLQLASRSVYRYLGLLEEVS
jgi:predicted AAA+ superfamily ATPase